jgi:D-xylose transport system permease protein
MTSVVPTAQTESAAAPHPPATPTLSDYVKSYVRRVLGGEMGAIPALAGIVVLVIGFTIARPVFLTSGNFANLLPQGAAVIVIAMGLVFVLLLGEIDLSAGYTSGVCAALMAVLVTQHNQPWYVGIGVGLVTGVIIGLSLGTLVAKLGVPSFVVTLAAFLAFQGILLLIVHEGNIVSIDDPVILAIGNKNVPVVAGWIVYGLCIVAYAALQFYRLGVRRRRNLVGEPFSVVALRVIGLTAISGIGVYFLSVERSYNPARNSIKGVPIVVPIVLVLLVVLNFVLKRTTYGLHLYAVGGNREAARRAGIATDRLRISAFVICSTLASIGGFIAASRANSVDPNTGGSNVLLYAVGAAVIGGTSLFGGKGRMLDAVLGGLVVAIIINGMGLLGSQAWLKYVVTGAVLLAAAAVDALSRRRASATGLR